MTAFEAKVQESGECKIIQKQTDKIVNKNIFYQNGEAEYKCKRPQIKYFKETNKEHIRK